MTMQLELPVTHGPWHGLLQGLGAFSRAAFSPIGRLRRVIRNRRNAAILAQAGERALADIGLTRTDVRDAFAEPIWRDPTELLAHRAGERGHGRARPANRRGDEFKNLPIKPSPRFMI